MTATRIATSVVNTGLSSVAKVVTIAKLFLRRKEKRKVQNENNDTISREALKEKLTDTINVNDITKSEWYEGYAACVQVLSDIIDNAPTVDALPREYHDRVLDMTVAELQACQANLRPQGKWDYEKVAFYGVCSNCGATVTSNLADIFLYEEIGKCPYNTNFCPNCGADMRGAE